jgi:hypothetical protein
MFGPFKEAMGGKMFRSDEEAVHETTTRFFFLEESIHFGNAGGPVLNEMETM